MIPAPRHIFGVFAPRLSPERRAALHGAMARAFPAPDRGGEDLAAPGAIFGARDAAAASSGPALLRLPGGGAAAGLLRLFRRPDGAPPDPLRARGDPAPCDLRLMADLALQPGAAQPEGPAALALLVPEAQGAGPQGAPGPRLILQRDMFGRAPLWLAQGPEGALIFSTLPAALLEAPFVSREADPVSLAMLLSFRAAGHGHAALRDLQEVPRGCRMEADARGIRTIRHARPAPDAGLAGLSPEDHLEALQSRLDVAVACRAARMEAEGLRIGLEFSGGLDSALIAAALHRARGEVTGMAAVGGDPGADDLGEAAERAARAAFAARFPGARIAEIPPEGADFLAAAPAFLARAAMPCPDPTAFSGMLLAGRMAGAGIGAAFSGMGGDFCLSSHERPTLPERWSEGGAPAALAEIAARRSRGGRLRNILIGDLVKPGRAFGRWMRLRPGPADPILAPGIAADPRFRARMAAESLAWRARRGWTMAGEEIAELDRLPPWTLQDRAIPGAGPGAGIDAMPRLTPLLDGALLGAALAAPPGLRLFDGPQGPMTRGLARRLLARDAPEIAARPDKSAFQPAFPRLQAEAVARMRADAAAFEALPAWREVVHAPTWRAALDRAARARGREALALSNHVAGPWFLGWWLREMQAR